MTALATLGSSPTMTSREIAHLIGKQHAHVMRDIRAMLDQLEAAGDPADANPKLDWHCVLETYTDTQGKSRQQYRLDRNTTLNLISGYSAVLRMRIINRLDELEHLAPAQAHPIFAGTEFSFLASCVFRDGRLVAIGPAPAPATYPTASTPAVERAARPSFTHDAAWEDQVLELVKTFLRSRTGERWTINRLEETHGGATGRFHCGQKRLRTILRRAVDDGDLATTQGGALRVPAVAR